MPWIPRGLREGIVTTRYPHRPDGYAPEFAGAVVVDGAQAGAGVDGIDGVGTSSDAGVGAVPRPELAAAVAACPTGAITTVAGQPRLDRGRCILCGRCAELAPGTFRMIPTFETATGSRERLVVPIGDEDDAAVESARRALRRRTRALRRSVHIRHVDAGSDGAEEWEVAALTGPIYDVQRLGIFFTASPRHADLLLVTGVGSFGMRRPLRHTFDVMPDPKVVVAAGVDAISGGLIGNGYAADGGVSGTVPVDVFVPGSPPSPFGLLHGILLAVGMLAEAEHPGGLQAPLVSEAPPENTQPRSQAQASAQRAAPGPASPEDPPREAGP